MKVYIHTDIEGVAGMVHFEDREDMTAEGYFRRLRLHKLLTGEVNAAIEGDLEKQPLPCLFSRQRSDVGNAAIRL